MGSTVPVSSLLMNPSKQGRESPPMAISAALTPHRKQALPKLLPRVFDLFSPPQARELAACSL